VALEVLIGLPIGVWALSPSQEEIFISQSLLEYEIWDPNPLSPPMPLPSAFAGPRHVPTLISARHHLPHIASRADFNPNFLAHLRDRTFRGRRCRVCGGQNSHDIYCPSIQTGFSCQWCFFGDGTHRLGCSGFAHQ
jgi:hypothetical protein